MPKREKFEGGGMRDSQKGLPRFDLIMPKDVPYDDQLLTRIAVHMGKGAEKYEDRNWESFSDEEALDRAKASAYRHFMQWYTGKEGDSEDHAAAIYFNVMAAEFIQGRLDGFW